MKITTFGTVDDRSLAQLRTCMEAGDADYGVLCADHHPGYSQPIGGAIAYEGRISPSGVGFDIGCVAAGTPVLGADGMTRPIERTQAPVCAGENGEIRRIDPFLGVLDRGDRAVLRLTLVNGRSVVLTPDHQVRTDNGWKRADALASNDRVMCPAYIGRAGAIETDELALLRIAGYVNGDGHLPVRGNRVSLYTSVRRDADDLAGDLQALGLTPAIHIRTRPNGSVEHHVYASGASVREQLRELGCPEDRKADRWGEAAGRLLALSEGQRAAYLSSFASAEMVTPWLHEHRMPNLAIKQRGIRAIECVAELLRSLAFDVSVRRADGENWVAQILGGEAEQIRFVETVGFSRAAGKRRAAARCLGVAWERAVRLAAREQAQTEVRELIAAGSQVRPAIAAVAASSGLTEPTVHHLAYRHGGLRPGRAWAPQHEAHGECAWAEVVSVEAHGHAPTYDVATADPAEAFVAGGIVVHNCGNKAALTDLRIEHLGELGGMERIMDQITERISFGMGVPNREQVDHPVIDKILRADFSPQRKLAQIARSQLGTVGSGNHYVNVMADEQDRVWVGVHFGSRGFGHKTASGFLAMAEGLPFDGRAAEGEMDSPPTLLETGTELGDSYIAAMTLAGEYAYAGRDVVVAKVLEILGASALKEVHNHHNYAWLERYDGRDYWVVRKGCTPARPGQEGFVGGSMGEGSVILEGLESPESEPALYSTVHGAGRVMSRTQAAGKIRRRKRWACTHPACERIFTPEGQDGPPASGVCPDHPDAAMKKVWIEEQVKPGRVDWTAVQEQLRGRGIVLRGGGADEAPEVYKRLPEVLAAHGDTIRVLHRLRPLGVAMAGRDIYDPYKD